MQNICISTTFVTKRATRKIIQKQKRKALYPSEKGKTSSPKASKTNERARRNHLRSFGLPPRESRLAFRPHEAPSATGIRITSSSSCYFPIAARGQGSPVPCSDSSFFPPLLHHILTQASKASSLTETGLHQGISIQHAPGQTLHKLEDFHGIRDGFDGSF
jgi:hypothetical protein